MKRRRKGKQRLRTGPDVRWTKPDINAEIRHITQLAQAQQSRIVQLGSLVLFSTRTGDAWLLDAEDHLALCLCRAGDPQPSRIIDRPTTFGIDWPATFTIEEGTFIVQERSGKTVAIQGYPTPEIAATFRK